MKLLRDVICRVGKGQGCSLLSATVIEFNGLVAYAKGKTPSQTITSTPWEKQANELEVAWQHNRDVLRNPRTFYPGQTYAGFSPQTEQALNLTEQRALAGSPVQQSANQELMRTLNGDYLHGGSGFNAAYQAAANKIIPQVESKFALGGRYGSGLAREAETSALADAFASQYQNERQNQLRSMMFAPEAASADYRDMQALAGVGSAREGQAQSGIDEAMARHDFKDLELRDRIAAFLGPVSGNYGNSQLTTGFKGNKGAGMLGSALSGAGVGASVGGPWGALAGGILGAGASALV